MKTQGNSDTFAMNLDELLKDAQPATDMIAAEAQIRRDDEVAELKETYSKKYLISSGLVTKEEYRRVKGESTRALILRRQAEVAELMPQMVGSEISFKDNYF